MNNILIAIPVWRGNAEQVLANLEQQFARDGKTKHHAIVCYDGTVKTEPLVMAAMKCFEVIHELIYDELKTDEPWPRKQNHCWQSIARILEANYIDKYRGWFFWEHDVLPLKKGWIDTLEKAYSEGRRPFMGHIVPVRGHMNGVAIYPFNISQYCTNAFLVKKVPFDVALSEEVKKEKITPANHLMAHHLKVKGGDPAEPVSADVIAALPETTVIIHGYEDRAAPGNGRSTFYHSGDLGDIIYSLPSVRELGGGEMILGPDNRTNMSTREKMTVDRARIIVPLLEAQPYVHSATFGLISRFATYDLNQMRILIRQQRLDMQKGHNLARCYLAMVKLNLDNDEPPWLTVTPNSKAKIIVNRTVRYRDDTFRWDLILRQYRKDIVFVGMEREHADFEKNWGKVPYLPTKDLLELAQVIAGCELFIGNQSCAYAIAEGLKKRAILESCPSGSNTIFNRPDVIVGCTENTDLPELDGPPKRKKKSDTLVIAGPIDWFTGLGRATCQLIDRLSERGRALAVNPLSLNERIAVPTRVKKFVDDKYLAHQINAQRLLITPLLDLPKHIQTGDAVMTMWESTRLPTGSVEAINKHASLLIVPCRWCADVFSANGVNSPIKVVPLGVDAPMTSARSFGEAQHVIGAAGRLAHGGRRKGIEDVIAAFQMAFPKRKDAKLKLKLFDDCYIPEFKDKRISVDTRTLTDDAMIDWYLGLTCFASLSKGEGWGLHVHEAAARGVPVIAPAYSGLADLVMPDLPFTIVPATEGYSGHWCQPNIECAAEMMANDERCEPMRLPTVDDYVDGILEALK